MTLASAAPASLYVGSAFLGSTITAVSGTSVTLAAAASLAKQAARMNGELEDAGAIKALDDAATIGEPEVRQVAVYALGFFGGPSATKFLRERIQSGSR